MTKSENLHKKHHFTYNKLGSTPQNADPNLSSWRISNCRYLILVDPNPAVLLVKIKKRSFFDTMSYRTEQVEGSQTGEAYLTTEGSGET